MIPLKNRHFGYIALGGFLLIVVDQALKNLALTHQTFRWYVLNPWLGWEFFSNHGIAFSLAVPQAVTIIITPPVILVLWGFLLRKKVFSSELFLAGVLITAGAISNYLDRLFWHSTVDYVRILFSVINLADVVIICGAFLLWKNHQKIKN